MNTAVEEMLAELTRLTRAQAELQALEALIAECWEGAKGRERINNDE